jgi:hypothetical protein
MPLVLRPVREFNSGVQKTASVFGTKTTTMFEFSPLARLPVLQVAGENPDIHCHHRRDTKYNQVFHVLPHFFVGIEIGRSGFG